MIVRDFVPLLAQRLGSNQSSSPFIQVLLGPRQVGKTTGVLHLKTMTDVPTHYTSADDCTAPDGRWVKEQWQKARALGDTPTLLIIDEIQKIPSWSDVVKGLWDEDRRKNRDLKVVLLGSASLSLHQGLNESLVGRFELLEIPHWSFAESQSAFGWDLNTFLIYGGYPGPAALIKEQDRWVSYMRSSILEPVITKDILPSRRITNHALFRQATQLALSYPAKEISYTKLLGQLQERGNVSTIKDYLKILEDAFLIRLLYKYSTRPLTLRTSSPKIIVSVPALCSVLRYSLPMTTTERGSVFESVIISHIARSQWPISYWRNGHYEVDAVIKSEFGLLAIEVKSTERIGRLDGLSKFIKSFPGSKGVVIDEEIGLKILTMSTPKDSVRWLYDITTG